MAFTPQLKATALTGSVTSHAVTFGSAPTQNHLIVISVYLHTADTITAPSGFAQKVYNAANFRTIGIYWKIAGASEPTSYTFTTGASASAGIVARTFSSTVGWSATQNGASNYQWDESTVGSVTTSASMTFGSLAIAASYCSNTTLSIKRFATADSWLDSTFPSVAQERGANAYKSASAGTNTAKWEFTDASTNNRMAVAIAEFVETSGPSISGTSDDTPTSGTTLTINGSNFGTQTGSAGVTVGGVSVTPSNWAASQIQIPLTIGANKYGANTAIVVTDSGGVSSSAYNVQIQPASGVNYVNLSGTLASSGDRITATPDLASGDQVEWSNVVGGTISDVTVNADASFVASSGVISFDVRVNDGTGWGTYATQLLVAGRGIVRPLVRSLTNNLVTNLVG